MPLIVENAMLFDWNLCEKMLVDVLKVFFHTVLKPNDMRLKFPIF